MKFILVGVGIKSWCCC